ncbi:formyltetrahydrofolate deformylase [Pararhizobium sp. YC-54]|uniref:formyltetrahydrofolate deformylase n=1 Tax=Pararhizobium sp. YC-54 TaxID=2986920 RepID=UPI0021F719A0|nr:formyltetrahydrofolate deformylase [Pararhizobium sp. YC-54]MCW0002297.1 formyltetrahydrofolate deformylase [Pararhizobium sp. YC-54]
MNCAATMQSFVLTLSCADRAGIVAAVTTQLASLGTNITESNQHWDRASNSFFMRIAFSVPAWASKASLEKGLRPVMEQFGIQSALFDRGQRPKMVIMVSKFDHALLHLLYQIRVGWLDAEVVAIISNHEDSRETAEWAGVPYYVLPVTKENKAEQEERILTVVENTGADLVVLARYMQVFSDNLAGRLFGKVINIHHSFLPSFKGARPYHQAHEHGVKLIGATAHYVTADLDEGPIIEQEAERVTHAMGVEDFVAAGRDIESRVLARAVKRHVEGRVMLNGRKTVVFA